MLRRQRQADPWGLLASKPTLICECQILARDCVSKNKLDGLWGTPEVDLWLRHTCVCMYTRAHTYLYTQHTRLSWVVLSQSDEPWWAARTSNRPSYLASNSRQPCSVLPKQGALCLEPKVVFRVETDLGQQPMGKQELQSYSCKKQNSASNPNGLGSVLWYTVISRSEPHFDFSSATSSNTIPRF